MKVLQIVWIRTLPQSVADLETERSDEEFPGRFRDCLEPARFQRYYKCVERLAVTAFSKVRKQV